MPPEPSKLLWRSVNEFGAFVAKPGAGAVDFLKLVSIRVPRGRLAIVTLYQALNLDPSNAVQNRIVSGLEWQLRTTTAQRGTADAVAIGAGSGGKVPWTFNSGVPVARNVFVSRESDFELEWGVTINDVANLPVELLGFAGGIVGVEVPSEWRQRPELLGLLSAS